MCSSRSRVRSRSRSLSVSSHQSFNKSQPVKPRRERLLDALGIRLLRNSDVVICRFGHIRGCRDSDLVVADSRERCRCGRCSCTHECEGLPHSSILLKKSLKESNLGPDRRNLYFTIEKEDLFKLAEQKPEYQVYRMRQTGSLLEVFKRKAKRSCNAISLSAGQYRSSRAIPKWPPEQNSKVRAHNAQIPPTLRISTPSKIFGPNSENQRSVNPRRR